MPTALSRTFRSGNSQAVRLPKEVALPDDTQVTIVRSGDVLTIYPAKLSVAEMLKVMEALPKPSSVEVRDEELIPEPPGL